MNMYDQEFDACKKAMVHLRDTGEAVIPQFLTNDGHIWRDEEDMGAHSIEGWFKNVLGDWTRIRYVLYRDNQEQRYINGVSVLL